MTRPSTRRPRIPVVAVPEKGHRHAIAKRPDVAALILADLKPVLPNEQE
jgi:hypothetical protein